MSTAIPAHKLRAVSHSWYARIEAELILCQRIGCTRYERSIRIARAAEIHQLWASRGMM